jgi:hypothetical protein
MLAMESQQASEEFARRYYLWSLGDARREIREDFRLLRSVIASTSQRYLRHLECLESEEQEEAMVALVKRFHPTGMRLAGDVLSEREHEVLANIREVMRTPLPDEVVSTVAELQKKATSRPSTKKLAIVANRVLEHSCGTQIGELKGAGRIYRIAVGRWTLTTSIGLGSRPMYFHRIHLESTPPFLLQDGIALLGWLGMAGQTDWDQLRSGFEEDAITAISSLCSHFLGAAQGLLRDL